MLEVMVADTDRTWLRTCALWLKAAGYTVTTANSAPALARTLRDSTPYGLRLIDSKLLLSANRGEVPVLASATPGFVWREHSSVPLVICSGRGTAVNCPRPRAHATLEILLHYILHPETIRLLDAAMVGEILSMLPNATVAEALIARFTRETLALVKTMNQAQALAQRTAWQASLHSLQGCAAAIGAVGLLDVATGFEARDGSATVTTIEEILAGTIAATGHSMRRAVGAYFATA